MTSRSFRLETRSRARDDTKRSMQTVEKVRKWEKRWVDLGLSNSFKVYKWVPVREAKEDEEEEDKENQPMDLTEQETPGELVRQGTSEPVLPEITAVQRSSQSMGTQLVVTDQALPELLLAGSEDSNTVDASKSLENSSSSVSVSAKTSLASTGSKTQESGGTGDSLQTESQVTGGQTARQPSPTADATRVTQSESTPVVSNTGTGLLPGEGLVAQQVSASGDPEGLENSSKEESGPLTTAEGEPLAAEGGKEEEIDERTVSSDIQGSSEQQPQTAVDIQQAHDIEKRMERQDLERERRRSRSPTEEERKKSRSRSPHS